MLRSKYPKQKPKWINANLGLICSLQHKQLKFIQNKFINLSINNNRISHAANQHNPEEEAKEEIIITNNNRIIKFMFC